MPQQKISGLAVAVVLVRLKPVNFTDASGDTSQIGIRPGLEILPDAPCKRAYDENRAKIFL